MNTQGVEVWRGGVNRWECDEMGHLNVRFYVARALEGLAGLGAALGMEGAFGPGATSTLRVREQHIRFLRESRPGDSLRMQAGVLGMEETEARVLQEILHADGGHAATITSRVAHVTPKTGRAFPWSARTLALARSFPVDSPPAAGPRSLFPGEAASSGSLARADQLGLRTIARGAVAAQDCDAHGLMRAEMFMGRLSEGVADFVQFARRGFTGPDGTRPEGAPRVGTAAVEFRLVYLDWPRAGDLVAVRSGISSVDRRTLRLVHWMLDPISGRVWSAAEQVVVFFDLDARKMVEIPEAAQATVRPEVVPGLAI